MPRKISTLPIGTKIKDSNTLWYNSPIVWKLADKNHIGYPENSVTLMADRILTLKCLDSREPKNTDSNRKLYGNNRYIHSNLRNWLNSDSTAGNWYSKKHATDEPPNISNVSNNAYETKAGFLNSFSNEFRNALLLTELTVAKNTVTDGGGSETFSDKIFLASNTEVGLENENGIAEGTRLLMFNDNVSRLANPSVGAVMEDDNAGHSIAVTQPWYWWLRTPVSFNSYEVRTVHTTGARMNVEATLGHWGVRPLCNLPLSLLVSDNTDEDGCYTIIWNKPPVIDGEDSDIGVKSDAFSYQYTITDQDNDPTTVTEKIDEIVTRTYTARLGKLEKAIVDGTNWVKLPQGRHTLKITATDNVGCTTTRTLTFEKRINSLKVALAQPLPATSMPKKISVDIDAKIPTGAGLTIEVCNNANDPIPKWEDVTKASLASHVHLFENAIKQTENWGVNIRVMVNRNTAIGDCYITGIKGNFE